MSEVPRLGAVAKYVIKRLTRTFSANAYPYKSVAKRLKVGYPTVRLPSLRSLCWIATSLLLVIFYVTDNFERVWGTLLFFSIAMAIRLPHRMYYTCAYRPRFRELIRYGAEVGAILAPLILIPKAMCPRIAFDRKMSEEVVQLAEAGKVLENPANTIPLKPPYDHLALSGRVFVTHLPNSAPLFLYDQSVRDVILRLCLLDCPGCRPAIL